MAAVILEESILTRNAMPSVAPYYYLFITYIIDVYLTEKKTGVPERFRCNWKPDLKKRIF